MKRVFVTLLALFPLALTLGAVESGSLIDFEEDEVGAPPESIYSLDGNEGQVQVSEIGDGAKALQLTKLNEADEIPRATWLLPPGVTGELSFTMILESGDYHTPLLNLFIFSNSLSKIGPSVYFTPEGMTVVSNGEGLRFPQTIPVNEKHSVQISLFDDQTYGVKINGKAVPNEGARFTYHHSNTGALTHFQFAIGELKRIDSRVYVDDIRVLMD